MTTPIINNFARAYALALLDQTIDDIVKIEIICGAVIRLHSSDASAQNLTLAELGKIAYEARKKIERARLQLTPANDP